MKLYDVHFENSPRYRGEPDFYYTIKRQSIRLALKAAEALYRRDKNKSPGAVIVKVEFAGTIDA